MTAKFLYAGQGFGEIALLTKEKRQASILCKTDCHFAAIDREYFEKVLYNMCSRNSIFVNYFVYVGIIEIIK